MTNEIETLEKETWTQEEVNSIKSELNDKYLRLYAEFENYKKRSLKEKEDIKNLTKIDTLSSILDIDNDLAIAFTHIKDKEGVSMIISKLDKFLKSQGIEHIQTDNYDPNLHEVVSILEEGSDKIIDVVGKGYKIGDRVIRHPKVILGK